MPKERLRVPLGMHKDPVSGWIVPNGWGVVPGHTEAGPLALASETPVEKNNPSTKRVGSKE